MKKVLFLLLATTTFLSACDDGVPAVADPHNPTDASGKHITSTEFLKKYCAGKSHNETCVKVENAANLDARGTKLPKGW